MPDMRDAIAQYLAFQGGQMPQGMMVPQPGLPSNRQGYPVLPSGQSLPTPISDTGPMPGVQQMPPNPDMPPPINTPPPAYPQLDEFGNAPGLPPNIPGPFPGVPPDRNPADPGWNPTGAPPLPADPTREQMTPPVDTPMQAPMDPMMRSFRGRY